MSSNMTMQTDPKPTRTPRPPNRRPRRAYRAGAARFGAGILRKRRYRRGRSRRPAKTGAWPRRICASRWAAWRRRSKPIRARRRRTSSFWNPRAAARTSSTALDQLAAYCDAGTRVVVIGRMNDVTLYRELVRRGVSDYLISPVDVLQIVRADMRVVLGAGRQAGRPHHRRGRRQRRRRRLHHRAQYRVFDRARPHARRGRDRSRSRLRHRRPRFQSGPAARHCRGGVLARPHRHRLHRPPAGEMHRSSQPSRRAGDARPRL